jgi:hypothetical protein
MVVGRLGGCGRIAPRPGRAVDPPGRIPGEGAGRVMPPPCGTEGRLTEPRLGRDIPPGRCGIWGRACGIWGRACGIWGRACGIWGRACGIWGRAMPPAGRAIPPDGLPMDGRAPPPGRASALVAEKPAPSKAIDIRTAADSRIMHLGERDKESRRDVVTSSAPAGATGGRSSFQSPAGFSRR